MPSFYGLTLWMIWLCLYWFRLIQWDYPSIVTNVIFALVSLFWFASIVCFSPAYRYHIESTNQLGHQGFPIASRDWGRIRLLIICLHLVGFWGIVEYVRDFSQGLGGYSGFLLALTSAPYEIRWQAESISSIGTQISYFGWIAISITLIGIYHKKLSRWWTALIVIQFLGNLLFIDRTRPIWIGFTAGLVLLPGIQNINPRRLIRIACSVLVAFGLVFGLIAAWVGKVVEQGQYGNTTLPPTLQGIYFYGTSGFAYFDHMVKVEHRFDFLPQRTIYPFFKATSALGMSTPPPSQINEFYNMPFESNVGTFLEPFYRDGGLIFIVIGIVIHSFLFDAIGLLFLKRRHFLTNFAWANICFINFIAFFTPKIASLPIWFFEGLGLAVLFLHYQTGPSSRAGRGIV